MSYLSLRWALRIVKAVVFLVKVQKSLLSFGLWREMSISLLQYVHQLATNFVCQPFGAGQTVFTAVFIASTEI